MWSKLHLALFGICCLPAFAQLDSSTLRAKLGQPLHQETFHMPAGFDVIVDYGTGTTLVCQLKVPAMVPRDPAAKISNGTDLKQRMVDFLADLVPASMRGKGGGTMLFQSGLVSMRTTEYENVTISEIQNDSQPENGTITIRFKNAGCQTP
jgi:hypothetical protein